MKYSDYIKVDENFQYSVNLQFDLNNINKIKNYIPTKDGCEVLKLYINSVINGKNRATTLIGPYGKGKSHLLLVLLMILSDYNPKDEISINELINKIKKVDTELFEMLVLLREKKYKLLPVIINSNYDDLNQAFLLGINDALERENIDDIVFDTAYDAAYDILVEWDEKHKEIKEDIEKCLKSNKCNISDLKNGLKNYDKSFYEIFKKVYECITHGQKYNPLINTDIIKNYKDITHILSNKGFTGLFIAFDEFSKFLDSSDSNYIMRDLKLLQDFAELANRTGSTEQIHLSCITHKGITEYLDEDEEDKLNAYKTVEGRFKNIYFNRSMEQNYEIVSYALKKSKEFNSFYDKYMDKMASLYLNLKELPIFSNTKDVENILFKGCFPLNPLTTYSLIELSEKIAQNERTLFTFLTDDDSNSLKSFINSSKDGLFNIDKVYDYFEPLFKNTTDSRIKDIWYKSSNILKKTISEMSQRVIKAISVVYMINELDDLNPNADLIRYSLDAEEKEYNESIDELIDKSLIRKKKITDELDFATIYSKQLTNEIKDLVNNQFSDINEKEVLNKIIGLSFTLPRRYNEEFKMTRFFTNVFISESELMNLSDFDILHDEYIGDGIVLNLIRTSKNIDEVIKHFRSIKDDLAILKVSKISFKKSFINLLKEYEAVNYLINNSSDDVVSELELMKNEVINAVKDAYKYYFSEENILDYVYFNDSIKKSKNISSILSSVCESVYYNTPVVNNELINKNELSAPIKKAREIVVDSILSNNKDLIKSKTSAEATIYKATVEKMENESILNVINIIKEFIQSTDNNKRNFEDLYKKLTSKPYSVRLGIIPILIALAINEYSDNIILYYMNREIELNAINLIKINDIPSNYYLLTEKGTVDKLDYINELENIYGIHNDNSNIRLNVSLLVDTMKKWVFSFPRIVRELNTEDLENGINYGYIRIKNELLRPDINNNEFLFIVIPDILKENSNKKIIEHIKNMKLNYDKYVTNYIEKLIIITKTTIDDKYKGSLSTQLIELNKTLDSTIKNNIYDIRTKKFINYLDSLSTHDEHDVIENLAKIFTSFYVEDWQNDQLNEYKSNLSETIDKIKTPVNSIDDSQKIVLINGDQTIEKNISSFDNISALGKTMKNNIEDIINEYGGSISEEEKVNILLTVMKKYM